MSKKTMKHRLAVFALVLAIFAGGDMADFEKKAHADSAFSFSLFYNSLSPYGSWVPVTGYGYGWYPAQAGPGWHLSYDLDNLPVLENASAPSNTFCGCLRCLSRIPAGITRSVRYDTGRFPGFGFYRNHL